MIDRLVQEERSQTELFDEKVALEKEAVLLAWLGEQKSAAVAFSGGVDSAYLAWAAARSLDWVVAITACAYSYPRRDLAVARELAGKLGIAHETFVFDEFQVPGFAENPPDRCYHCKTAILTRVKEIAAEHGIVCVLEGSNRDDDRDYRPGARAIREQGVRSPLKEVGLTKGEIRWLSRRAGLPTWNKQAAACLASRFAYGETITQEGLRMVEQAEDYLRQQGFDGQLRVRIHGYAPSSPGSLARLELSEEALEWLLTGDMRRQIVDKLKEIGFAYVTLDLQGYRMGSMNEVLRK